MWEPLRAQGCCGIPGWLWLSALMSCAIPAARTLHEVSLHESIRYAPGDPVEKWLNDLLCLDCLNITRIISGCPLPDTCDLYPRSVFLRLVEGWFWG